MTRPNPRVIEVRARRLARTAAFSGLLFVCAALPSSAHPGHTRSSRLIKLDLAADPPRLGYGLVFEPADADAGRKRADADGDGKVNAAEGDAELERLTAELRSKLSVCRGATLAATRCSEPRPEHVLEAAAAGWADGPRKTLALSWEFRLDLAEGDVAVRVTDTWTRPEVDRNDGLIEAPETKRLSAAGRGDSGTAGSVVREFTWPGDRPEQPRSLFVAWEPPTSRVLVIALVGAVALLMLGQLALARLRRQRGADRGAAD